MVKGQALWTFNRYLITRAIWKGVFVPAISFGNSVKVHSSKFWGQLDRVQREVIRFSLGCRFNCSREFIQGEGGMSGFEEREVQSKLRFWRRLGEVGEDRWIKGIQKMKKKLGIKTKWDRRVEYAARVVGYKKAEWEAAGISQGGIKAIVKKRFDKRWKKW